MLARSIASLTPLPHPYASPSLPLHINHPPTLTSLSLSFSPQPQPAPLSLPHPLPSLPHFSRPLPPHPRFLHTHTPRAAKDIIPKLERLKLKATSKVREFLLDQVGELRKKKTNVQIIQEHLLKFKYFVQFLADNSPDTYNEVRNTYVSTIGRIYLNLFKTYHTSLSKLHQSIGNKNSLLAVESDAAKKLFGGSSSAKSADGAKKTGDLFILGTRDEVLQNPDAPAIIAHVAAGEQNKYPYEQIFRSVQKHLMDTATSEYHFTLHFFNAQSLDIFNQIFAKALSQCLEHLEHYLFSCHDAIGLLIMIRIMRAHQESMRARQVPALDSYFDRVNMLLWPRFKSVFDANLASVRSANAKKVGPVDLHPHFITCRYANLATAVMVLHGSMEGGADNGGAGGEGKGQDLLQGPGGGDGPQKQLQLLRVEIEKLLGRLAAQHNTGKAQMIFLVNSYDQVSLRRAVVRRAVVRRGGCGYLYEDRMCMHGSSSVLGLKRVRVCSVCTVYGNSADDVIV